METINSIELRDESVYPDNTILSRILGSSYPACCAFFALLDRHGLVCEWRYYRDGKAWLCKAQKKSRTIVWMSVWKDYLQAAIYVTEKNLDAVYGLDISAVLKEKIRQTKNVGKSRPCIFEIRTTDALEDFEKVMLYKIAAK